MPSAANVRQAVPFFFVADMTRSLRFYVEGLGFRRTNSWIVDEKIRWCWLELDAVALMLQEIRNDEQHPSKPEGKLGEGVSICFMCDDALAIYHDVKSRGIEGKRPFVGNNLWVSGFTDPDGYRIDFESPTDIPDETEYDEKVHGSIV
jgi:lactoylglutathione lyase